MRKGPRSRSPSAESTTTKKKKTNKKKKKEAKKEEAVTLRVRREATGRKQTYVVRKTMRLGRLFRHHARSLRIKCEDVYCYYFNDTNADDDDDDDDDPFDDDLLCHVISAKRAPKCLNCTSLFSHHQQRSSSTNPYGAAHDLPLPAATDVLSLPSQVP